MHASKVDMLIDATCLSRTRHYGSIFILGGKRFLTAKAPRRLARVSRRQYFRMGVPGSLDVEGMRTTLVSSEGYITSTIPRTNTIECVGAGRVLSVP